jgi:hypothetical protein
MQPMDNNTNDVDQQTQPPQKSATPFCSVLDISYYQPYFSVSTVEVCDRLKSALIGVYKNPKPNDNDDNIDAGSGWFLGEVLQRGNGPDLYGPFWLTMTLVFIIAVTSNISSWLNSSLSFSSDITIIMNSLTLTYGLVFGVPIITHYFVLQCLAPSIGYNLKARYGVTFTHLLALQGYSMIAFVPALLLCIIPNSGVRWLSLLAAFVATTTLIIKNVGVPILNVGASGAGGEGSGGMSLTDHARESFSASSLLSNENGEDESNDDRTTSAATANAVAGGGGRRMAFMILVWLVSCQALFVLILGFGFYS